ncbi:MAG: alpha/beta fold hydrolase [Alphaproteobacteria bacterium]|nr:alpha/beta fold hydrolase [Alphaproteobacteria bacterium]
MARPDWSREGRTWPNREASRFVSAGGLDWHVQVMGQGPDLILVHGTGAASHSWRDVAPRLAARFRVIVPDLPGHGFTSMPPARGLTLPGMATALRDLLAALEARPAGVVGHSAGAAVALRLSLDGALAAAPVVSFNGALRPFAGRGHPLVSAAARALFFNPVAVSLFAWRAGRRDAVRRLIASTGSHLDARGLEAYAALFHTTGQVEGALGMMAHWDLAPLIADLPALAAPLTLIAAEGDLAVPPEVSREVHARLPRSTLILLPRLGHLAHEEDPEAAAALIETALATV